MDFIFGYIVVARSYILTTFEKHKSGQLSAYQIYLYRLHVSRLF